MNYYTTKAYSSPCWTTNTTSSTNACNKVYYDCSGWVTNVVKKPKGLDKEKITEDMVLDIIRDDE